MDKLQILVVTRSYPAADNLYQYPFVHRRVRAYRDEGHQVAVFRPSTGGDVGTHSFEDVQCTTGDADALGAEAARFRPDVLAVHGLGPRIWSAVERLAGSVPMAAWLHGSEIPGFLRRKAELDRQTPDIAANLFDSCSEFWRGFLAAKPEACRMVFPSRMAVQYMEEGVALDPSDCAVIANPIDTGLFRYERKAGEQRFNVLFIRPFDSRSYGNDLAIAAISSLQTFREFETFRFSIFGDGPLFADTVAPLRTLPNVSIERHFLTQAEIADKHKSSGVFLVPTRLDTQGVSRDEAMSSGLVPVTNAVGPIPEFLDDSCAIIAPPDDPDAIASALVGLAADPEGFEMKSERAARRIRATRSSGRIIPLELDLLHDLVNG